MASLFFIPPLTRLILNPVQPLTAGLIGGFLLYTSATLIIGGRDVRRYGSILFYEGVLRFFASALLIFAGGFYVPVLLAALTDALWGVALFTVIFHMTGRSVLQLALDKGPS